MKPQNCRTATDPSRRVVGVRFSVGLLTLALHPVGMTKPTRGVRTGFAVALEAETVKSPFQADHIEAFEFGFDGVAGDTAEVAGRLLVVAAGAVLDLPV